MSVLHPQLKWAQRTDKIFLTIQLRDIQNQQIDLEENSLKFACQSNQQKYSFDFNFCKSIVKESSKWSKTGFSLTFVLMKKQEGYWPRLTQSPNKLVYLQIDWDKWVDEDEQQEENEKGLAGLDQEQMQNFDDSDDEDEAVGKEPEKKQQVQAQ